MAEWSAGSRAVAWVGHWDRRWVGNLAQNLDDSWVWWKAGWRALNSADSTVALSGSAKAEYLVG